MYRQDDWADRSCVIQFLYEKPDAGQKVKTRKFASLNGNVPAKQIMQCAQAISRLTPNGDGPILIDMYDHFEYDPETELDSAA